MEEIKKELDKIVDMIIEDIRLIREKKEGYQEKLKSDEIKRRRRKVNLRLYDDIIKRKKYCGMRGA